MAVPTTVDPDTELSAVNTILGAIGQSPVTTLGTVSTVNNISTYQNPEISFVYNLLKEASLDVQNEGWMFNKEEYIKRTPDANKEILIPANVLRMDTHDQAQRDMDVIIKDHNGTKKLYDKLKVNSTTSSPWEFDNDVYVDIVYWYEYDDIPGTFKRYITYKAAGRAATQLVGNPQLTQLLAQYELQARAAAMEYECTQGDHNYLGMPRDYSLQTYQPYRALRR